MYWLSRPPYWRWTAAIVIVVAALYLDLSGPPTEPYPFTAQPVAAGDPISIEWRRVPAGLLPPPEALPETADRALAAGTPLVPGVVIGRSRVPDGWWALDADLPDSAAPGRPVLVAIHDGGPAVTGVVLEAAGAGSFGSVTPGVIAVPPDHAAAVAAALAQSRASVLFQP